ncbi:MAG: polyketide synthase dehydratase domain-containing protein [Pseudomonadota bacterium]|nr:polyketide synthase dehydratase domain-containing protein [Pseudomonadota bacterium]
MERPATFLVPGTQPVIGRMFEAGIADDDAPSATAPPAAPVLPFVDAILALVPGVSIVTARQLTLERDRYLGDHNFVHAPDVKPLAACFPVVPMTVSLEVMAETAACLAPGCGLVGFETVAARRWIAVEDGGSLALRIEGQVVGAATPTEPVRVAVQIYTGDNRAAAIEGIVRLATSHPPAVPRLAPFAQPAPQDATVLYRERHLFHGTRFQGLCGPVHLSSSGASATLQVRSDSDWFAGEEHPQLLTDAALLDCVGQLIAVWAGQHGQSAFPVGVARLDLIGPTPAPGALLPICLRITGTQLKMLAADVEIGDGRGGLWARINGWSAWLFGWAPRLVAFQRDPAGTLLSEEQTMPEASAALHCRSIGTAMLKNFDLSLLARHYLHASEWAGYCALAGQAVRQRQWLLGRVAAKDAVRAWCGAKAVHPATFAVIHDAAGQPGLAHWPPPHAQQQQPNLPPHLQPVPHISIAHSGARAVGAASDHPVGIDVEQIATRDAHWTAAVCTPAERILLEQVHEQDRDAWLTRLWCAKEAFGKRLGTGVTGGPRRFEVLALAADYSVVMHDTVSCASTRVLTSQEDGWMLAVDTGLPAGHVG